MYELIVSDLLNTEDGSSLDVNCVLEYSDNAGSKTAAMGALMTEAMDTLCGEDVAAFVTYTYIFTSLGQQVL